MGLQWKKGSLKLLKIYHNIDLKHTRVSDCKWHEWVSRYRIVNRVVESMKEGQSSSTIQIEGIWKYIKDKIGLAKRTYKKWSNLT